MITLLLRLYPARWRARYGDEFGLVLAERPLGPFDIADVLLGALDAHLHLRDLGAAASDGKGFAMTLRIGGYAAILGGLMWFTALGANAINDGGEQGAFWIGLVLVVATITTLIALIGLSAFQARRFPALVWAAFIIPATGAVVALLGVVAMAVTGDSDQAIVWDLSGWAIASLGLIALLAGSVLFALATWRTRSLSRAAAALLALGAIIVVPGLGGLTGGLVPQALAPIALLVSVLLFPAGWIALGISAVRTDRAGVSWSGATS